MTAPVPTDEAGRLTALTELQVLDTDPEEAFDDLIQVAKATARVKIALISLVDAERQWFKAKSGVTICETPRDLAFCAHAILQPKVLWVEDARRDARFADNPLVTGAPYIRFYAGAPLDIHSQRIGTLCVIDDQPRAHDPTLEAILAALARSIAKLLLARKGERVAERLLGATVDSITCFNERDEITFWNPAAEKTFGYTREEAIGRPISCIVPERLRESHAKGIKAMKAAGASPKTAMEVMALHKDGHEFPIELSMATWRDGDSITIGSIVRDVSARKEAEQALALAKTQAEAANVAKSVFLANMSHEIRTPLNGVIGVADLLARTELSPRQGEMAELIQSSANQLQHLLGDILDIARIEAGEMTLVKESFSILDIVRSTVEVCALKAKEKGLQLTFEVRSAADRQVRGDPIRTKQVLSNLISNAIKFTVEGCVDVRVQRTQALDFEFIVSDTGAGFDPAAGEQLFGQFQQADGSITRRFGGSGLGLAICRQLVELMGGRIRCDSRPGIGSEFAFVVPLDLDCSAACVPRPLQTPEVDADLSVLVADDHPNNRLVVKMILESLGANITCVENGAEAVEAFQNQPFDLVLMDMMMPVLDGLSATRAIRDHEAAHGLVATPVLMLTANAMPEHIEAAHQAGADQHVAKPITAGQLVEAITATSGPAANREAAA